VILSSYALLVIALNSVIQCAIVFLGRYSISVEPDASKISSRSKLNIFRGSLALAFGLVCVSLFLTRTANYGAAFAESRTGTIADEQRAALPPKEADLQHASLRAENGAPDPQQELEQSPVEIPRGTLLTAARQSEEKGVERAVLVKPDRPGEERVQTRSLAADSFASLSKEAVKATPSQVKTTPSQVKDGFVGIWAADARACEARAGAGSDLRTVIGQRGARAGSNSCSFKEKKQTGNAEWEMKALCADGSSRWESTVRLSLSKNKLKWSGQRGAQTYIKCG
jgi:hypothetical protein